MKTCTVCGTTKPYSEFGTLTAAKDGHRPACKDCAYKANLAWRHTPKGRASVRATNAKRDKRGARRRRVALRVIEGEQEPMPHCQHCEANPRDYEGRPHCRECGWSDRPRDRGGVCRACRDWVRGRQPVEDFESAALLLAAIVERARQDAHPSMRQLQQPPPCEECPEWLLICGSKFIDVVTEYGHQHDGDPVAMFGLVALIALDGGTERLVA